MCCRQTHRNYTAATNSGVTHLENLNVDGRPRAKSADDALQAALGKAVKNFGDATDVKAIVQTFNRICMVRERNTSKFVNQNVVLQVRVIVFQRATNLYWNVQCLNLATKFLSRIYRTGRLKASTSGLQNLELK